MTLLLNTDDTARLIRTEDAIDTLDAAYRAIATEDGTHRVRSDLVVATSPTDVYTLATMEGAIKSLGVAAIRMRSDYARRVDRHGLASSRKWALRPGLYCGLVVLYSLATAEPLAIINDGHLQVMRVGATSALAGRYLARADSKTLGIIGASHQARGHARAYVAAFPLEEVKVFSRTPADRDAFAEEMTIELGIPVRAVGSAREAVEGCDIVAACTSSRVRLLEDERWIEEGSYTSSIRWFHEFGREGTQLADVLVLHNESYGPVLQAGSEEDLESGPAAGRQHKEPLPDDAVLLHDVVAGLTPGRTNPTQRTFFNNNMGKGIQFAALGKVAYDRAIAEGIGRELPTEWFLQDIST